MKTLLLISVLFLTGCANSPFGSAVGGGASYRYTKIGPDGSSLTVEITTARDVGGGTITVSPDGEVKSEVETAGGAAESIQVIREVVGKIN